MPQLWVQSRLAPNFVLLPSPYYPNMSHPDATLPFRNLIQDPIPSMVPMTRLAPIRRRPCRYHAMPMHIPRTQLAPTFPRVPVIPPHPQPCPRPETLRTRLICAAHCHSALTQISPCRTTRGFYLGRQPPTFCSLCINMVPIHRAQICGVPRVFHLLSNCIIGNFWDRYT